MRYLGGKSRIAKDVARVVSPRGLWWEPFVGGGSVTPHLAKYYPEGLASDVHPALIALYQNVQARGVGWLPAEVTQEQYQDAKTLPDTDPIKAFVGFGCAFGGKWFGGYARRAGSKEFANEAARTARSLTRCVVPAVQYRRLDFLEIPAVPEVFETLYCDPPYQGTEPYQVAEFDTAAFWRRAQDWATAGSRVFVSEYTAPKGVADLVWEKPIPLYLAGTAETGARVERIYRVRPCS